MKTSRSEMTRCSVKTRPWNDTHGNCRESFLVVIISIYWQKQKMFHHSHTNDVNDKNKKKKIIGGAKCKQKTKKYEVDR